MFTQENFNQLNKFQSDLCISIYIPTYRSGNTEEDRIRLKNALQEVTQKLESQDMSKKNIHDLIGKAENLLDSDTFFSDLSDGLAMFISENFFEYYTIPVNVNQNVHIGQSFLMRPLMPILNRDARFFVLALSQNEVRFFEGSDHSITPVKIDDLVPANMEEALNIDEYKSHLQFHSGNGVGANNKGKAPMYHGHGGGEQEAKHEIKPYFRKVDEGLMKMLHDERVPMVIATTDDQAAMYHEVSEYKYIMEDNISGNVENDDPVLIHEKAWAIMQPHFKKDTEEKRERFNAFMAEDKASFSVTDIIPAAINGKVDTLYLNKDNELWGTYNEKDNSIDVHKEPQADSVDLLDLAARKTHENSGTVYNIAMENMPRTTAAANAIYRF